MNKELQIDEVPNVLSAAQCAALIDLFKDSLEQSKVKGLAPGTFRTSKVRTSSSAQVALDSLPADIREVLSDSVTAVCGLPPTHFETWQLVRYLQGEQYGLHHDALPAPDAQGLRAYSALFYLRVPAAGGETVFPYARRTIEPQCGKLVVWPNISSKGVTLHAAMHQSKPVLAGEKWSFVTWVRQKPFLR